MQSLTVGEMKAYIGRTGELMTSDHGAFRTFCCHEPNIQDKHAKLEELRSALCEDFGCSSETEDVFAGIPDDQILGEKVAARFLEYSTWLASQDERMEFSVTAPA